MGKYQEAARYQGEDAEFKPPEGYQFEDYLVDYRMHFSEYQDRAKRTAGEHTAQLEAIQNWTLGLAGEAGEFSNLVKKAIYHNHGFNYGEMVSELGDVLWYLSQLCTALGIKLELSLIHI